MELTLNIFFTIFLFGMFFVLVLKFHRFDEMTQGIHIYNLMDTADENRLTGYLLWNHLIYSKFSISVQNAYFALLIGGLIID